MKIATYNIWDSQAGMPQRFWQIVKEIVALEADIICLQEVGCIEIHKQLATLCHFEYSHYQSQMGIAVLSKYPILEAKDFQYATWVRIMNEKSALGIINVHLPSDRMSAREKAIVEVIDETDKLQAEYKLLMGDFNCSDHSSIHRYLKSEESLWGSDAYYFDMAEVYSEMTGTKPEATLNFRNNPRWGIVQEKNTIEINQRFDRIMLENPYPNRYPMLKECRLFGTDISEETKLAASDHYGVYIVMDFTGEKE